MSAPRSVYFIEAGKGGHIKIGVAVDVGARLKDLQSANPQTLRVIVAVPGNFKDERRLHRRFKDERLNGEWFRGDGAVRAFADSLIAMSDGDRLAALAYEAVPAKTKRKYESRHQKRTVRRLTRDEWHALFFVGDGPSVFRSEEAESLLLDEDRRRVAHGLHPRGFGDATIR